jgi:uroporphyrinogen decarboxylase
MTSRQRFLATIGGRHADRPPLWEEGVEEDTLAVWRRQGLPADTPLSELFLFDRREVVEVSLEPLPSCRHGDTGPKFAPLRAGYRPEAGRRLPIDWERRIGEWPDRDYPLGMGVSRGLFRSLGIEDGRTLEQVFYAFYDAPSEIEATLERATELSLWALDQVLPAVDLEFALLNEPIASFHAPVVSPAQYRRFALPHLRRLIERLRNAGVAAIVVQAYGQVEALVPLWLEAGVNTLWCYHAWSAGMGYVDLRHRYGADLRLIGGMPAPALLQGKEAIDEALGCIVAPLLEQGGYLPLLDDRVRVNVPYEQYRYYRTRLQQLVAGG